MSEQEPLSSGDIAAFLDGRLRGEDLARLESRLADDPAARQEVIKASRIIASAPHRDQQRRIHWIPVAGLAAVAALAFVAIRPRNDQRDSLPRSTERQGVIEESGSIGLIVPVNGQSLGEETRSFAWHGIEGATYRLFISDATGRTVLRRSTSDTVVALPDALLEKGAGTYYWSVDALAPDGSSVTSGVREFVVGAR
ncbi:MAG: hypothetical protein ABJC63_02885 [Gemmatimonadales bacterium]